MSKAQTLEGCEAIKTPNAQKSIEVRRTDLPLHCPQKGSSLWNSHPRVYIPIEDSVDQQLICPYCGTKYTLKD